MEQLFKTALDVSVSASALCILLLAARLLIGRRPTFLLPLLGALLIIRLAVPVMIPSPLSVLNLFDGINIGRVETPEALENDAPGTVYSAPKNAAETDNSVGAETPVNARTNAAAPDIAKPVIAAPPLTGMEIAAIAWLSGAAILAACIVLGNIRFSRMIRKNKQYSSPGFEDLLEACKSELHITKDVRTVQLSGINTAAVYGVFKPKLLVSPSFRWLSDEEKRHVLLHELAHIKRRDTVLCLLITALNVVYWFNPLVWAALRLLRGDMEVMCDMAVLKRTDDKKAYAATLLSLVQSKAAQKPRLVTALFMRHSFNGLFVSTDGIKRRMKMISRYKKNSALFTVTALILVLVIAIVGCTGPAAATESPGTTASSQNPEQKLIAAYYLDISSLPQDVARTDNMIKAIELLDGTVFPAWDGAKTKEENQNRRVDIKEKLGSITREEGWKDAPEVGFDAFLRTAGWIANFDTEKAYYVNKDQDAFKNDIANADMTTRAGGGTEIVLAAVWKAMMEAGIDKTRIDSSLLAVKSVKADAEGDGIVAYFYMNGTETSVNIISPTSGEAQINESEDVYLTTYDVSDYTVVLSDIAGDIRYGDIAGLGIGACNNSFTKDLTLKISLKDNAIIAAFYAPEDAQRGNPPPGY